MSVADHVTEYKRLYRAWYASVQPVTEDVSWKGESYRLPLESKDWLLILAQYEPDAVIEANSVTIEDLRHRASAVLDKVFTHAHLTRKIKAFSDDPRRHVADHATNPEPVHSASAQPETTGIPDPAKYDIDVDALQSSFNRMLDAQMAQIKGPVTETGADNTRAAMFKRLRETIDQVPTSGKPGLSDSFEYKLKQLQRHIEENYALLAPLSRNA